MSTPIPDVIEIAEAELLIDQTTKNFFAPNLDGVDALRGPAKLFRPKRTFFPGTDYVYDEGHWSAELVDSGTGIIANTDAEDIHVIEP